MGFLSSVFAIFGFIFGTFVGLIVGFHFFIYSEPGDVEERESRRICEMDTCQLQDIMPAIPFWVKCPDYDRVDWLSKFLSDMWPYLDKAICCEIQNTVKPMFAKYIGKYGIQMIEFEKISLGTLPPKIHGLKVYETNESELVMEPAIKWAGNPNIVVAIHVLSRRITVQLVDLQVFAAPRVTLKPLVPTLPCFATAVISLMEKPHVDFGLKILGGDFMSIPGLYHYVQETIKKKVANLYLWPQTLEIPILDSSVVMKKPVGILHLKVVKAIKLMKMDLLGLSDPYVKLHLSRDRSIAKKTMVKKKTLNPEWNEKFKLIVKEPESQFLNVHVYDWDKVGTHDRLGMQIVPLKLLTSNEPKEFTLDLLKHTNIIDPRDKKQRGKIVLELTYVPFKQDSSQFSGSLEMFGRKESSTEQASCSESPSGAGLLSVIVYGAKDVEGVHHNNPYAAVLFRGEKKKSKMVRRNRDPQWNEEFQYMLEEPPLNDKIHIEVHSKRTGISFRSKESLGHVDINLGDVVHNGRINQKYHLINSKNGLIHVGLWWKTV